MGQAFPLLIALIVGIPLLLFELPALITAAPKWTLKILCFLPLGCILFVVIHAFRQGQVDVSAFVMSIPFILVGLYGGFTLKSMVE